MIRCEKETFLSTSGVIRVCDDYKINVSRRVSHCLLIVIWVPDTMHIAFTFNLTIIV